MYSLNEVLMSEDEWTSIHASKYHYWAWVAKFYLTHPNLLWRDLWWRFCPGEIVKFNSKGNWTRRDFEYWLWANVGVKHVSWGLRIDNWVKNEYYDFAIKIRKGKIKYISHLALVAR